MARQHSYERAIRAMALAAATAAVQSDDLAQKQAGLQALAALECGNPLPFGAVMFRRSPRKRAKLARRGYALGRRG